MMADGSEQEQQEGILLPHHEQQELCTTRPPYRQGKKLTAVKVYTTNNESRHLLIFNVPAIKLKSETKKLCRKYGTVKMYNVTEKYKSKKFTETFHIIYQKIEEARVAKRKLDGKNFYGDKLHVCYAPELETAEETRDKIMQRQNEVLNRLRNLQKTEDAAKKDEVEKKEVKIFKLKDQDVTKIKRGELKKLAVKKSEVKGMVVKKVDMGQENTIILNKNPIEVKETVSAQSSIQTESSTQKITKRIVVLKKIRPEDAPSTSSSNEIILKRPINIMDLNDTPKKRYLYPKIAETESQSIVTNDVERPLLPASPPAMLNQGIIQKPIKINSIEVPIEFEDCNQDNDVTLATMGPVTHVNDRLNSAINGDHNLNTVSIMNSALHTVSDANNTYTLTDVNSALNYNSYGNENIREVSTQPLNTIVFHDQ